MVGWVFAASGFVLAVKKPVEIINAILLLPGIITWGVFSGNSLVWFTIEIYLLVLVYKRKRMSAILISQLVASLFFGLSMGAHLSIADFFKS